MRDDDPDELGPTGIPVGPPDLDALDWEGFKRDLHNALFDRGLATWADVQAQQNGVTGAILSALRNRVVRLYRQ